MADEKRIPQQPQRPNKDVGQQREEQENQVPQRNPDVDIEEEEMPRDPSRRDENIDDDEDVPTGEQPPLEPEEHP